MILYPVTLKPISFFLFFFFLTFHKNFYIFEQINLLLPLGFLPSFSYVHALVEPVGMLNRCVERRHHCLIQYFSIRYDAHCRLYMFFIRLKTFYLFQFAGSSIINRQLHIFYLLIITCVLKVVQVLGRRGQGRKPSPRSLSGPQTQPAASRLLPL